MLRSVFDTIGHQVDDLHQEWFTSIPPRWLVRLDDALNGERYCILCGCTDRAACDDGCSWAGETSDEHGVKLGWVCTSCAPQVSELVALAVFTPGLCQL